MAIAEAATSRPDGPDAVSGESGTGAGGCGESVVGGGGESAVGGGDGGESVVGGGGGSVVGGGSVSDDFIEFCIIRT